ncbi:uroporphyrinogen-III C-methyltransferase [Actinotalea caeni]|uniref:uroporphyrinogen-III C-methyltransferase n=1 Tax=Actinotalea caeni TaxID=1348467 RepID=UPI0012E2E8C7|nr:uroporphyrinogen-III C-methyltransferase [Actinotalea caeni]
MEVLGLRLAGRQVLVTGGGPRAADVAARLRATGARVRVVAALVCEDLRDLAAEAAVDLVERDALASDLDDVWLVASADDGPSERARVRAWAEQRCVWCLDPDGTAALAETTDVAGVRIGVLADDPRRAAAVGSGIADLLDEGRLDLRGDPAAAGRVTLIGGGPGSPELITVQGRRALAEADVVVTDRLGPRSVLRHVRPGVEVIDVGKTPGHHPVPQHEINAILVERARRGQAVVRLKGGDPFVFGRGGEEVQACRAAGVPVTVVPGISSAIAVPELAGIPLTQRGVVAAFHVTSGHEGLDPAAQACVRDGSATVVVLMGVSNLGLIVEQALAAGAPADTPVAIVERGSTPEQRVTRAPLAEIVAQAAVARVRAPAVVVVGAVADPGLLADA